MPKPKKGHFQGTRDCHIHTSREGTCEQSPCQYVTNTPAAPPLAPERKFYPKQPRGSHHVLCVTATIRYQQLYKGKVREKIDEIYKATKWCVNQEPNLVWLPLKGTYTKRAHNKDSSGKVLPAPQADIWDLNLPCHDWGDHNCKDGWTDDIIEAFKTEIWNKIQASLQGEECFEEKDMIKALGDLEEAWNQKLLDRGNRAVKGGRGTRAARQCQGEPKWWFPFSMAKNETAICRPVRRFGAKADVKRAHHR